MAAAAAAAAPPPLERRLLLASFAATESPAPESSASSSLQHPALPLLERGDYAGALAAALRGAWQTAGGSGGTAAAESTPDWFSTAAELLQRLLNGPSASVEAAEQLLLAAVAALYLFTQANLAGPCLPLPECPFDWLDSDAAAEWERRRQAEQQRQEGGGGGEGGAGGEAGEAAAAGFGRDSTTPGDRWAAAQLSESGEDLVGRIQYPQYLLLARTILLAPLEVALPGPPEGTTYSGSGQGSAAAEAASTAGAPASVQPAAGAGWLQPDQAAMLQGGGAAGDAARQLQQQQQQPRDRQLLAGWCWWGMRAVLLQQRLLSGRSALLRSLLLGLAAQALRGFAEPVEAALAQQQQQQQQGKEEGESGSGSGSSSGESSSGGGGGGSGGGGDSRSGRSGSSGSGPVAGMAPADQLLAAGALLEAALLETAYGHGATTKALLQRSSDVLGFCSELTGALGTRTVHQQEAKAQLVVRVTRQPGNPWTAAHAAGALPDRAPQLADLEAACNGQVELPAELKGFAADSDVMPHPKLQEGAQPVPSDLHSLEQALLLGWCLHVRKGSAADGLQPWELAAYVDAVARQQRSQFLLHSAAALQACRLEKQRSRTRDRALLQLERLAEAAGKAEPSLPPELRMRYAFSAWFPLQVQLRKELGELLVGMGLVGAALSQFEALELWDNLIVCYQLLDKKVQAEELIKRRLEVTPDEPRLWCALGDLCLDDAHYLQAWERSGHRNARSQRSLARNALRNSQYAKAAQHWEAALALNPLHGEGWFSLGYCYIKEKDYPSALRAFTRSSQLEPENGEAWNNLAAIHMHLHHWPQAFNALSEAIKHKRDSWQTWENYAQVAVQVQQWQAAVRALQQVLVLSDGQRVDLAVLAALVGRVEAGRGCGGAAASPAAALAEGAQQGQQGQHSDAAVAAEGAMPAEDASATAAEAELAEALGQLSTEAGGSGSGSGGGDAVSAVAAAARAGAGEEAVQRADARAKEVLEQSVGQLMKQVASTVSGDSAFWQAYARFQTAMGYPDAAKECLLKRVRALGGSSWQASAEAFDTYAHASAALCEAYLQAAEAGGAGAQRDLSSARLHLRGLLKQALVRYEDTQAYRELQALLERVEAEQQRLQAAATAGGQ